MAQRMRLCMEAVGSARIEKVYTLHDHHEITPRISYEVSIGDLHAGDVCHVPILVWLPKLHVPAAHIEIVRFTLFYVDALKIDTKSCNICASISRPAVIFPSPVAPTLPACSALDVHACLSLQARSHRSPGVPIPLLRERNRVLVAEALQQASLAANNRRLDTACSLLVEAEAMISTSPAALKKDPLSAQLLDVLNSALHHLENALGEHKCRSSPSPILDKLPAHHQMHQPLPPLMQQQQTATSSMRSDVRAPGGYLPLPSCQQHTA